MTGIGLRKIPSSILGSNIWKSGYRMASIKIPKYDCFLVLDFEATCEEGIKIPNQEIIEFPVIKLDANSFDIVDLFHKYVRPVHNPQLTDFCTELTGITQEMVDESKPFSVVFESFKIWMEEKVGLDKKFLFVTCGDWDLKSMLPEQCERENLEVPDYCKSWINIKKAYADHTGNFVKGIMPMLKELNLKHVGRLHSGIDDCNNIAHILKKLSELGCVLEPTSVFKGRKQHLHGSRGSLKSDRTSSSFHTDNKYFHSQSNESPLDLNSDSFPPLNSNSFPPLNSKPVYSQSAIYPSLLDWNVSQPPSLCSNMYDNSGNLPGLRDDHQDIIEEDDRESIIDNTRENLSEALGEDTQSHISVLPNVKFDVILHELKENISSPRFDKRNRAELKALLAAGKYLNAMEEVDRAVVETRLRFYYVGLCHGWKTASRDSKVLSTSAVGIDVDNVGHSTRHKRSHHRHARH